MLRRRRVSERVSPGFIEVIKRKGNLAELKKKKDLHNYVREISNHIYSISKGLDCLKHITNRFARNCLYPNIKKYTVIYIVVSPKMSHGC